MNHEFYAFGEILWDCLPSGRHAGGAPFNVAAHLAQLGVQASLLSAVGQDALGSEIRQVAEDKGINCQFVSRARVGLPTGTVLVTLDADSNATYELVQPAAWDEIIVPDAALAAVAEAGALIFGSLAGRSPYNLEQLDRLLSLSGPVKFFDVNLRPPFVDPKLVIALARRADVLKLNDIEVGLLASWLATGEWTPNTPATPEAVEQACEILARETNARCICVTRAAEGAALWEAGQLVCAPAPHVAVKDTVGAGDAFMAGLMVGYTRDEPRQLLLERACRLGAFVASHNGATPLLPAELTAEFTQSPRPT